ncbi:MAG TPA: hypothetical protein VHO90_20990 [Bacteroidales bacterium]|nr:hypothetical protein [Bacteroidales bacterium]
MNRTCNSIYRSKQQHDPYASCIRNSRGPGAGTKITALLVFFFISAFIAGVRLGSAQQAASDSTKRPLVKYTPEFKYKEGVYLNFDQVKNNDPIPKYKIISTVDFNDPQFFDALANETVISFYDELGLRQEVSMRNVWGYCRGGMLYVRMRQSFNKINIIGNICHFVATITTQNNAYNDPFYYNPYYYYRYSAMSPSYSTSELRQFIMDYDTGKIYDYDVDNLEALFIKDPELHDEYMGLSKKKRQQLKFLYIRKFNERNPLLIPN